MNNHMRQRIKAIRQETGANIPNDLLKVINLRDKKILLCLCKEPMIEYIDDECKITPMWFIQGY